MPHADINGFRMYYEVQGEGLPVLYIHGGMGGARSLVRRPWELPKQALPGLRFIFYDRRGFARSEAPEAGYDLPTFAEDALALLDYLAIERAVVDGSSAGGPIALQLALSARDRVIGLILRSTSAYLWPPDEFVEDSRLVRELIDTLEREGAEAAYDERPEHTKHALEPLWRWPDAERHGWLEESKAEETELASCVAVLPREEQMRRHVAELRTCKSYIGADLRPQLGEITCPVLIIHGKTDATVAFDGAQTLLKELPKARLVAIRDVGHRTLNHPETQQRVRNFLEELSTSVEGAPAP